MIRWIIIAAVVAFGIIGFVLSMAKDRRRQQALKDFLAENDGVEFFCYTHRRRSQAFIERELLPFLDGNVIPVLLRNRRRVEVDASFDAEMVWRMLGARFAMGFPWIVLIHDG